MKTLLKTTVLTLALAGPFVLVGCEQEGPMEEAADQVEEAADNAGDAVEEAGDELEDATDDAG